MSEAPAGNCRGFGDEDDIRRDGCCRGSSAAGISVYIILFIKKASGRALWGARIPVIPVTVMGHRIENYTTSSRQQEGTG